MPVYEYGDKYYGVDRAHVRAAEVLLSAREVLHDRNPKNRTAEVPFGFAQGRLSTARDNLNAARGLIIWAALR